MQSTRICSIGNCERERTARGLCLMHYKRAQKDGSIGSHIGPRSIAAIERLFERVDKLPAGCWVWTGSVVGYGYGQIKVNGRQLKTHRYVYEQLVGDIPDGMFVCHKCDNPPCCNPDHLFLGTPRDNTQDMVQKGRRVDVNSTKSHCPRGHAYSSENTRITSNGSRACIECDRQHQKRRWAKTSAV
jgi:hypothetical protein